jgi:Protein of unknown function (DUF2628)
VIQDQLATPPYQGFSEKWRTRFEFFDNTGGPLNKDVYNAAFKPLSFGKKMLIGTNFFSFFFGPIYWGFALRLWKKALALLLIILVMAFLPIPHAYANAISLGVSIMFARSANYAYYLKQVKGKEGWNPFEGMPFI